MQALILEEGQKTMTYKEVETLSVGANEVLVKVRAGALNHRDVYITQGLYPGVRTPIILGSDGAGVVEKVGANVDSSWLRKSVIMNPSIGWDESMKVQPKNYRILGMPDNGTFADYVKIDSKQLAPMPKHLSFEQAAALPLGGLTAYRALVTKTQAQAGEKALISGIGGGVALFAFQFAVALGLDVYVTSGSDEKIAKAIAMGAKGGANYKAENWHKSLKEQAGGFDVIIDSAGGDGFKYFLDLANPAGRIAFYGGTRGSFKVNPQKMFWKQLSLFGSTMGNDQEFAAMTQLVEDKKILPVVDSIWDMKDGNEAFAHMDAGKQFGKIVLKNPD
ncbi:MAG: zinc-binding dehydrogenase [Aureispira sp.]|nr:zinc-binding dehydrogenase [Aureispira sp.]